MAENKEKLYDELEENTIIELADDKGSIVKCEFLDMIEFEGKEYAIVSPVEGEDQASVIILECKEEENSKKEKEEVYETVDDDELISKIYSVFKDKWKDEYDFED